MITGNLLQTKCHLQIHARKTDLQTLNNLKPEEKEVILLRYASFIFVENTATIFTHHETCYFLSIMCTKFPAMIVSKHTKSTLKLPNNLTKMKVHY